MSRIGEEEERLRCPIRVSVKRKRGLREGLIRVMGERRERKVE